MSTTIQFVPTQGPAFQFQATLDGQAYNCTLPWNVASQRFYLTITDNSGNQLVSRALVGSVTTNPLNLVGGYFTSSTTSIVYYPDNQSIVITP